ncbi:uncharacterized protein LOC142344055 isoform X2 [Convolutriloba macropyga]
MTSDKEKSSNPKFNTCYLSFLLITTICMWYFFSSVNVISAKKLTHFPSVNLAVSTLMFGQYSFASLTYIKQLIFGQVSFVTDQDALISVFYFSGNLATLLSLALTSVSLNQVIKCLEPIFTVTLSALIFDQHQDAYQNFYMAVAVLGACISAYTDLQFSWSAVFLACLSNLSFACRNVYLKFSQIKEAPPFEQLGRISFCCLAIVTPYWLIVVLTQTNQISEFLTNIIWIKNLIYASCSHTLYNFYSLQVLSHVENAVSHGLLNILKRPITILSSAVLLDGFDFGQSETKWKVIGITVLIIAQFLYRLKLKPFEQQLTRTFFTNCALFLLTFLLMGILIIAPYQSSFYYVSQAGAPKLNQTMGLTRNNGSVKEQGIFSFTNSNTRGYRHILTAKDTRHFALYYLQKRFYRSNSGITNEFCKRKISSFIKNSIHLELVCKALLLKADSESDIEQIRKLGIVTSSTYYDQSQIKFMLFQLVINHITIPTYNISDIRKFGGQILKIGRAVSMHYFHPRGLGYSNWGDIVGPDLLEKLSGITVHAGRGTKATLYGVGSILQNALNDRGSWYIWGSGLINKPKVPFTSPMTSPMTSVGQNLTTNRKLFSVRGPESQVSVLALQGVMPFVAKDPGLLTSKIYPMERASKYAVCIIPHYVDSTTVTSALNKSDKAVIKIVPITVPYDFKNHVDDVPKDVTSCKKVLSSSLHGLIVSHSYGIPAAVITLSSKIAGGNWKYRDYYESLGIFMERNKIRHQITDTSLLANADYLSGIVDRTPQPKHPISVQSIVDTYPFDISENIKLK